MSQPTARLSETAFALLREIAGTGDDGLLLSPSVIGPDLNDLIGAGLVVRGTTPCGDVCLCDYDVVRVAPVGDGPGQPDEADCGITTLDGGDEPIVALYESGHQHITYIAELADAIVNGDRSDPDTIPATVYVKDSRTSLAEATLATTWHPADTKPATSSTRASSAFSMAAASSPRP